MFYFKGKSATYVLPVYFHFFDQQEFQILFACWPKRKFYSLKLKLIITIL